jgi:hypothetical protein
MWKIFRETRGVFKPPKKRYYFGRIAHGSPHYYPWNFNRTILTIRKHRPKYLRCKYFKLFGYEISYGWPIVILKLDLGWKDKYDSPRMEWVPFFHIHFFNWQFSVFWNAPYGDSDKYYEMMLWYWKYCDKDIKKAEETWGWTDYYTKLSTWDNGYLMQDAKRK